MQQPHRLPKHKKKNQVVQQELMAMLDMGVVKETHSDGSRPLALVPTRQMVFLWFCMDFRKVSV